MFLRCGSPGFISVIFLPISVRRHFFNTGIRLAGTFPASKIRRLVVCQTVCSFCPETEICNLRNLYCGLYLFLCNKLHNAPPVLREETMAACAHGITNVALMEEIARYGITVTGNGMRPLI